MCRWLPGLLLLLLLLLCWLPTCIANELRQA
jgi:hypothetical protein